MNQAKRQLKKAVKARKRRAAYLRRKASGASRTIDFSKFVESLAIPTPKKKETSFFSKLNIFKRK